MKCWERKEVRERVLKFVLLRGSCKIIEHVDRLIKVLHWLRSPAYQVSMRTQQEHLDVAVVTYSKALRLDGSKDFTDFIHLCYYLIVHASLTIFARST